MKQACKHRLTGIWGKCFLFLLCILTSGACSPDPVKPDAQTDRQPSIFPDYTDVTFPLNIAAPNFRIMENGEAYYTEIGIGGQLFFSCKSSDSKVIIPGRKWKELTAAAADSSFFIRIFIQKENKWIQYKDIVNTISAYPVDPYMVYRLLYPGYELWNQMGIYQRDLTTYQETPLLENKETDKGCMNCHTFCQNSPETMMIHLRGKMGGTLICRKDGQQKVETKSEGMRNGGTYAAWHPQGRYLTFSVNEIQQYFHSTGQKPIEVSDSESDLILLDTQTNQIFTDSLIYGKEWMETFPAWSPDGNTLYYCRSKAITPNTPLDSIRYDLFRIPFDPADESFGNPECVYAASTEGKSVSFPRVSPDGMFLMFTCSDYGNFSIWHPESELYLLNLQTGDIRNMKEVNSDNVESFHTWSSTGRWFVFSSKRIDGLWAHPFIASFDPETGKAGKPFMVPQKDPDFYKVFTKTFNLPELIVAPVNNKQQLTDLAGNKIKQAGWKTK